mgnify:CR=1 FL=1
MFTPATLGFLFMAIVGMKKLTYFSRLRRLLRAANDWTCDLPSLARKAQIKQETAYDTVTRLSAAATCPMPPFPTITARFTWTIRSCRRRQSLPQRRRPSLPNP